jgi:hypothetical protein
MGKLMIGLLGVSLLFACITLILVGSIKLIFDIGISNSAIQDSIQELQEEIEVLNNYQNMHPELAPQIQIQIDALQEQINQLENEVNVSVSYTMIDLANNLSKNGNNNLKNAINGVIIMLVGIILMIGGKVLWYMKYNLVSQIIKFIAVCLLLAGSITTLSTISLVLSSMHKNNTVLSYEHKLKTNFNVSVAFMFMTSFMCLAIIVLYLKYKLLKK